MAKQTSELDAMQNKIFTSYFSARYFEDEEVLNRVPGLFLFLGGIFAIMQFIALLLLRPPSRQELKEIVVLYESLS